jgi:hypothetical protein
MIMELQQEEQQVCISLLPLSLFSLSLFLVPFFFRKLLLLFEAARDNNVCGVGVAYRAGLSGVRLISKSSTDIQEAAALKYNYHINQIYSNSWGPVDDGRRKEGPGTLAYKAMEEAVQQGRNGLGIES